MGETADGAVHETYVTALRLEAAGELASEIARQLGVDETAVPALLEVARRKLTLNGADPDQRGAS